MDFDSIEKLKILRKELAQREGVELFMIFSNATLLATVTARPETLTELEGVKGWGPKKVARYGREVLAVIKGEAREEMIIDNSSGVITVGQLIGLVNNTLNTLGTLKVRGEITRINWRGGNAYAELKDAENGEMLVNLFIGRFVLSSYAHLLQEGFEVVVTAMAGVYKTGRFNLNVQKVEPVGEGTLKRAMEELKRELGAKGYFAIERKRPLPEYIERIAVITSREGDAIHDFRRNLGEYGFLVELFDVRVEGDLSEEMIIKALGKVNKRGQTDIIVLTRGGGSLESLRSFNGRGVAEAIYLSKIPVLVGVGHEKDETIAEYVADLRASTPTGTAVLIRQGREALLERLASYGLELIESMRAVVEDKRRRLERGQINLEGILRGVFSNFRALEERFFNSGDKFRVRLERYRDRLKYLESNLTVLNPEVILKRGYSIIYDEFGQVVREAREVKLGSLIKARVGEGSLTSRVERVE